MAEKWKQKPQEEGTSAPLKALTRKEVQKGPHFARYQFLRTAAETVSDTSTDLAAYLGGKATQCVLDCRLDVQKRELASQCSRCGVPLKPCNCSSVQAAVRQEDKPGGGHPGILRICKVCGEENWTRCATMKAAEKVAAAEAEDRHNNREMSTLLFIQSQGEGQPQGSPANIGGVSLDALPVKQTTEQEGSKENPESEMIDLTSSPERPSKESEEHANPPAPLSETKRESETFRDVGPIFSAPRSAPPTLADPTTAPQGNSPWKSDIPLAGCVGSEPRNGGHVVQERIIVENSSDDDDREQSLDFFFNSPRDGEGEEATSRQQPSEPQQQVATQKDDAVPNSVNDSDPQQPPLENTDIPEREGPDGTTGKSPTGSNNNSAPDIALFPRRSHDGLEPADSITSIPGEVNALEPPVMDKCSDEVVEDQVDGETAAASEDVKDIPPAGDNATGQSSERGEVVTGGSNGNSRSKPDKCLESDAQAEDSEERVNMECAEAAAEMQPPTDAVELPDTQVSTEDLTVGEAMDIDETLEGQNSGGSPTKENDGDARTVEEGQPGTTAESVSEGAAEEGEIQAATPEKVQDDIPSENAIEESMNKNKDTEPATVVADAPSESLPEGTIAKGDGELPPTSETVQEDVPSENDTTEKGESQATDAVENMMEKDETEVQNEEETETGPRESPPTSELDVTVQTDISDGAGSKQVSEKTSPLRLDEAEQVQPVVEAKLGEMEMDATSKGNQEEVPEKEVETAMDVEEEGEKESEDCEGGENQSDGGGEIQQAADELESQTEKEEEEVQLQDGPSGSPQISAQGQNEKENLQKDIATVTEAVEQSVALTQTDPSTNQMESSVQAKPEVRSVFSQNMVSSATMAVQTKRLKQQHVRIQTQVKQRSKLTQATPPEIAVKDFGVGCRLREECADVGVQAEIESPVMVPKVCDMGIQCVLLEDKEEAKEEEAEEPAEKKKASKKKKKKRTKRTETAIDAVPQTSKRRKTEEKERLQEETPQDVENVEPLPYLQIEHEDSGKKLHKKKQSKAEKKKEKERKKEEKAFSEKKKDAEKESKKDGRAKPSSSKAPTSLFDFPDLSIPAEAALPPKKKAWRRFVDRLEGGNDVQEEMATAFHRNLDGSIGNPFGDEKTDAAKKGSKKRKRIKKKTDTEDPPAEQTRVATESRRKSQREMGATESPSEDTEVVAEASRKSKRKRMTGKVSEVLSEANRKKRSKKAGGRLIEELYAKTFGGLKGVLDLEARKRRVAKFMGKRT
ncbi:hypothetical protein BSKO_09080 [Bryopsis sp. KO-2023]|nr:hypothetical protein BSKO_09080 [Bryopsis sp. KO-2023]